MDNTRLTQRQKSVLHFLKTYIKTNGYPPSLRDVCAEFGIKGAKNARKHLEALERKGFISRHPNRSRAIDILGAVNGVQESGVRAVSVPIAGSVQAGEPHLAIEDIIGYVNLDPAFFDLAGAFLLKVEGESMINAGIAEGDLLVVKPGSEASNNDIVVAMLGGEATVKRFFKDGSTITLQPENPDFEPIRIVENEVHADIEFSLIGRVINVIKSV